MRFSLPIAAALLATFPSLASAGHVASLVPIGLSFAPAAPEAVSPDHPLYHRVAITPVSGMLARVGGTFTLATRPAEFDAALRDTLDRLNMLAQNPADARVRLTVAWGDLAVPFHVGFGSHAEAKIGYTLSRIDTGQPIFSREIVTKAEARGGDAVDREQENARLALATNLASMAVCIDQAAYGRAPADCALTPLATYHARRDPLIIFSRSR